MTRAANAAPDPPSAASSARRSSLAAAASAAAAALCASSGPGNAAPPSDRRAAGSSSSAAATAAKRGSRAWNPSIAICAILPAMTMAACVPTVVGPDGASRAAPRHSVCESPSAYDTVDVDSDTLCVSTFSVNGASSNANTDTSAAVVHGRTGRGEAMGGGAGASFVRVCLVWAAAE